METYVNNVVFPPNRIKRARVDIRVEEQRNVQHGEHVAHTLGAEGVGQNLDCVADEETGPGQVVEGVVEEDHEDDGAAVGLDVPSIEALGENGPDYKGHAHATGGDEEERATSELVDEEAHGDGGERIPDVEHTVDFELHVGVRDADRGQHTGDVV